MIPDDALSRRDLVRGCALCAGASLFACDAAAEGGAGPGPVPSHDRPMWIDRVGLRVRDMDPMVRFYADVIGLTIIGRTEREARLGVDGTTLVELAFDPTALPPSPEAAGLYHVAFEMKSRLDLARWIASVAKRGLQVAGLADHRVTESVYLHDPEGNGVEVYVSRPETAWRWSGGRVDMGVFDLDVRSLLRLVGPNTPPYEAAPGDLRIGHIHLKVGDLTRAERFYSDLIGFQVTRKAPGVVFMSSGHYHHHVATNVWETEGAAPRAGLASGLAWFSIAVREPSSLGAQRLRLGGAGFSWRSSDGGLDVDDPWGTTVRLTPA